MARPDLPMDWNSMLPATNHGLQQHGKALVAEGGQGHGGDFGIIAEEADEGFGIEPAGGKNDERSRSWPPW